MRAIYVLGAVLGLLTSACKRAEIPPPPPMPAWQTGLVKGAGALPGESDAEAAKLAEEYVALIARISPETATRWGLHAGDGELDDRSKAGEVASVDAQRQLLHKVDTFLKHAKLSVAGEVDMALLRGTLVRNLRVAIEVQPLVRRPDVYTEPLSSVFLLLARDFAPETERARSALNRIERLPETVATAKENLASPPALWVQIGIESAKGAASFFAEVEPQLLAALPGEKARIKLAVRRANEAYKDYARFLEKNLLPKAPQEFAAGRDLFTFLLREDYFVNDSPEDLRRLGEEVFTRTEAEMAKLAKTIDPAAADWPQVLAALKKKHPTADQILPTYRKEVVRAREFLVAKDAVPFPDDEHCDVVETPAFLRGTLIAAYDQPPPFDANARGLFYVTPVDPKWSRDKQEAWLRESDYGDIVDTTVHEAYPGHHLQLSFARLHPSRIRKVLDTAIFAEGWALYSEELMHELGYYTPEERMLVLEWTLVRAARVVLDVGLHVQGMSYRDAVAFLTDRVHLERALAENEVKRYSQTPTQPLSYMVGREKIFALRARYQQQQGQAYSLKKFHHEVLTRGTLPPALLEKEMFAAQP